MEYLLDFNKLRGLLESTYGNVDIFANFEETWSEEREFPEEFQAFFAPLGFDKGELGLYTLTSQFGELPQRYCFAVSGGRRYER